MGLSINQAKPREKKEVEARQISKAENCSGLEKILAYPCIVGEIKRLGFDLSILCVASILLNLKCVWVCGCLTETKC